MLYAHKSADLLRIISNEMSKEDKTHRFYALQWLWDLVAVKQRDGWVELTKDQESILEQQIVEVN